MSINFEQMKKKSLWRSISDDDFEIDFSIPVMFFSDEGSITFVKSKNDIYDFFDGCEFFCEDEKSMAEDFKDFLRRGYFGYMYVDIDFFKAIEPFRRERIDDVKGMERTTVFVMYDDNDMDVLDIFDFRNDGTIYGSALKSKGRRYFVNLDRVMETNPIVLLILKLADKVCLYIL